MRNVCRTLYIDEDDASHVHAKRECEDDHACQMIGHTCCRGIFGLLDQHSACI